MNGHLPWRKMKDRKEVGRMKATYDHSLLIRAFPSEFGKFLNQIRTLTYFDIPDYPMLQKILEKCMKKVGASPNDPFDWEEELPSVTFTSAKAHASTSNAQMYHTMMTGPGNMNTDYQMEDIRTDGESGLNPGSAKNRGVGANFPAAGQANPSKTPLN
jgi:hypothetical protein